MKNALLLLLFIIFCSASFSQVNLDSGLVAYYPFSGNANDASGNGNNAVFNNATLTSDRFGNSNSAYSFNGVDNYIRIPNSSSLNTGAQISLCAYVKVNGFYNGPCHGNDVINKGQYGSNTGFYFIRFDDNAYTNGANCSNPVVDTAHQNFYGDNTSLLAPGYSPYISENEWYCLIYTYDGATAKFFVDGNLKSQASISGLSFGNVDDLFFGRLFDPFDTTSFPYWLNGDLDDVRIYNRAINDQEISSLCPSALPVTLTKFEATTVNKQIKLNWNVENEEGIRNFALERSITGNSNFVTLGTIVAGNNIHSYSFVDNTANVNQNYYYRLAILENDGELNYSQLKQAIISTKNKFLVVYPNPSTGTIAVRMNGYSGNAKFVLVNSIGQVVLQKSEIITANNPLPFKLSKQSKGIYWLKVETNDEEYVERITIF